MFLFVISMSITLNACAQQNKKINFEDIKEIWVYDYFQPSGYTTAGAYGQMIRLERKNISKFKLEQSDVDSLCRIMQEASLLKFFHDKWGSRLIFAEIVLKDEQKLKIFIASNAISVEIGKNYLVKDEESRKWLDDFRNRIITSNVD